MSKSDLEIEYDRIIEASRIAGEVRDSGDGDKRAHPRLRVDSSDLFISTVPEFSIIDMSLSGLAFFSNHPLAIKEIIHLSLSNALSVDAEVLRCSLEESASEFLDAQFRIQCRFLEDYMGMELLVTMRGKPN